METVARGSIISQPDENKHHVIIRGVRRGFLLPSFRRFRGLCQEQLASVSDISVTDRAKLQAPPLS